MVNRLLNHFEIFSWQYFGHNTLLKWSFIIFFYQIHYIFYWYVFINFDCGNFPISLIRRRWRGRKTRRKRPSIRTKEYWGPEPLSGPGVPFLCPCRSNGSQSSTWVSYRHGHRRVSVQGASSSSCKRFQPLWATLVRQRLEVSSVLNRSDVCVEANWRWWPMNKEILAADRVSLAMWW